MRARGRSSLFAAAPCVGAAIASALVHYLRVFRMLSTSNGAAPLPLRLCRWQGQADVLYCRKGRGMRQPLRAGAGLPPAHALFAHVQYVQSALAVRAYELAPAGLPFQGTRSPHGFVHSTRFIARFCTEFPPRTLLTIASGCDYGRALQQALSTRK